MRPYWNILIVDDEPDVHEVVRLVFRHLHCEGFDVRIASAYSAAEARNLLLTHGDMFHVALVDGVMESMVAGLDLCRFICSHAELTTRVILHTGVFNAKYVQKTYGDIFDAFLPKAEVTALMLYQTILACLDDPQLSRGQMVA